MFKIIRFLFFHALTNLHEILLVFNSVINIDKSQHLNLYIVQSQPLF